MQTAWDYLQERMAELGISPKRSLGQNFLISDHVIEKIIKAVFSEEPKSIIEVGPGLGALTRFLKDHSTDYQAIELDRKLADYWRSQGVTVTEADALKLDWGALEYQRPVVFVSNLPYQISSSLVIERTLDKEPLDTMILMFQKEVAQRIKARQQDDTYGMLSVVAQSFWEVETLLEASSRDFYPPPKVASRVLIFRTKNNTEISDKQKYLNLVKACFLHPRKLMISNLQEAMSFSRAELTEHFQSLGFSEKVRAGEITVKEYAKLYKALLLR